ncbi:uncharacterized protein GGS22DRAFT_21179 [Annulohypoxylon maeteangense]|uniref:uncharacterized protein n=1 Tax=Annulohypoxylon maeteangense TaxID=1927788 RepID=UPI002007FA73|nr:uncharacterized protein GGS22DRAFT_21179 [Annulohypoxylon maeteangense]KAI0884257.1 hypothetical protein GGS22DRAFT_21179 [Annulohypoxylon maeteangense]
MAAQDPNAPTDSNGGALVATAITMLIFSWLSVSLRSFVRARLTNGFQWDDWIMLLSQLNFTASCVLILVGVQDGLGKHNKSLDQFHEIQALMYQAIATATYVLNMWLIKLSIGIFLLRLATQKRYKYTLYASIVIVSIWSVVLFFWNIFQCNPVAAQWDYTILANDPTSHCVSADEIVDAAYALSVMNILSDWMYALIPIPMLWSVKMSAQAKLTVVVVLGLGIFASIATLVRLKFLADLTDMADILHAGTDAMVWTLIEPGVAIVASSLVTIRPLLRLWKIKGFGSTGQSHPTNQYNSNRMSRTNRSSKMPGFGSTDVTLVDIESQSKISRPRSSVAGSFVGSRIQRSRSVSDGASFTSRSLQSRASSDAPMFSGYPQRSRSISDADTLTGRSQRSRPSHLTRLYETPIEEDDAQSEYEGPANRRIAVRSEMYIIEGNVTPSPPPGAHRRGETWLTEQDSSNDGSFELSRIRPQYNTNMDSMELPRLPPTYRR